MNKHKFDSSEAEAKYRLLFEQSRDAITIVSMDGHFIDVNPAFLNMLKYSREEIMAMNAGELWLDPEKRQEWKQILKKHGSVVDFECCQQTKNGEIIDLLLTSTARVTSDKTILYQTILRDITKQKLAQDELAATNLMLMRKTQEIERLASTDHLTNILNRRGMIKCLYEEIKILQRVSYHKPVSESSANGFSIAIGDIDDFKQFNDQFGHDCGDYILKKISEILLSSMRGQDQVARWGGEEFLLLLRTTDLKGATVSIERIRKIIETTALKYKDNTMGVTMTFGVSMYSCVDGDIDTCINNADKGLYQGKTSGKNCVIVHK